VKAFDDIAQLERKLIIFFKKIHDYGRVREEIERVENYNQIFNIHSIPLIVDSYLISIPTIINLNLPKT
jgi:hypothetical protein